MNATNELRAECMRFATILTTSSYPGYRVKLVDGTGATLFSAYADNHAAGSVMRSNIRRATAECEAAAESEGWRIKPSSINDAAAAWLVENEGADVTDPDMPPIPVGANFGDAYPEVDRSDRITGGVVDSDTGYRVVSVWAGADGDRYTVRDADGELGEPNEDTDTLISDCDYAIAVR